jgi:hypothetical protein
MWIGGLKCCVSKLRELRDAKRIGQEVAASLNELEAHYYSSVVESRLEGGE